MPNEADVIAFVPNAPFIVSETISGETIIMHHGTGHYFDTLGTGTNLWEAIAGGGAAVEDLANLLTARHGASAEVARAAAGKFIDTLRLHDLIKAVPALDRPAVSPRQGMKAEPFHEPVLGVHTDLADMLLLDPIHDVGEAGWPSPPPVVELHVTR